eukprot:jgi/Botrbrau1/23056/Bobra.0433s0001.1
MWIQTACFTSRPTTRRCWECCGKLCWNPWRRSWEADLRQAGPRPPAGQPPGQAPAQPQRLPGPAGPAGSAFLTRIFSIREVVKQRLSASFYNHAALSPVDTRAYADMASLAMSRLWPACTCPCFVAPPSSEVLPASPLAPGPAGIPDT